MLRAVVQSHSATQLSSSSGTSRMLSRWVGEVATLTGSCDGPTSIWSFLKAKMKVLMFALCSVKRSLKTSLCHKMMCIIIVQMFVWKLATFTSSSFRNLGPRCPWFSLPSGFQAQLCDWMELVGWRRQPTHRMITLKFPIGSTNTCQNGSEKTRI